MTLRSIRAVLAALALLAAAAVPSAAGAVPAVVYSAGTNADSEIYVRTPGGTPRQLTRNRAEDRLPTWSPDRRRIAFVSDRSGDQEIYTMRANGRGVRRITRAAGADLYPAWSPDGRSIAFSSQRGGHEGEIYVAAADGSGERRLTRTRRTIMDMHPTWSPDGRWIAFASNGLAYSNIEIYRLPAAGGGALVRMTHFGTGDDGALGDDAMPSYSPDGSRFAFVSDRTGTLEVWTADAADGRNLRQVTDHGAGSALFPRFSDDGASILYMRQPDAGRAQLWTRALTDDVPRRLWAGADPDW